MSNNGNNELFSVFQFFVNGSQEKVLELVEAERAVICVRGLITSIGAKLGTTQRIIITDTLDCCALEWIYGQGVVFPRQEDIDGSK